jgi:Tfp pilus assembly protein PilN
VGLVGVLGLLYLVQLNRVGDARERLEAEEARVAELEAEVAELQEFQDLESRRDAADTLLATAFGNEVSFAGVLQDIAAVYPTDAQLETLTVALTADPAPQLGAVRVPIGLITATGATLQGHAPGVERLLLELGKVASFSNVFFSNSTQSEEGIAAFTVDVDLGEEARTRRYADGLPEELR